MAVLTQPQVNAMRLSQSAAAVLRTIKGSFSPRLTKAQPFKSVGFGQIAILELDESKTIQTIEVVTNLPFDMIESISFEYQDGSEFSVLKPDLIKERGRFLDKPYQEFLGNYGEGLQQPTMTRFTLDFADSKYETTDAIRRGELVVLPGETIRMKVRIKQHNGMSYTPETIELGANIMESPAQADRFFVSRFSEMIIDQNVVGEQTHKFPLMGIPHRIRRMYILNADAIDLEYLEIIRDRAKVYWGDIDDIRYSQVYDGKNPEMNFGVEMARSALVIDFTQNGYATESAFVPVANESLQLKLRTGSAGAVRIAFEYITQVKDIPTSLTATA